MKRILQNSIIVVFCMVAIMVCLYLNKLAYHRLNFLFLFAINTATFVYVILLIRTLVNHFENENDL